MTSAPLPPTSSSDPPATGRPELRRSSTDRMAGGVCGGLAEYTGIDSLLWRVGMAALTLAGGSGVVVYLLLWVLMPAGPRDAAFVPTPADRIVDRLHVALDSLSSRNRG